VQLETEVFENSRMPPTAVFLYFFQLLVQSTCRVCHVSRLSHVSGI